KHCTNRFTKKRGCPYPMAGRIYFLESLPIPMKTSAGMTTAIPSRTISTIGSREVDRLSGCYVASEYWHDALPVGIAPPGLGSAVPIPIMMVPPKIFEALPSVGTVKVYWVL